MPFGSRAAGADLEVEGANQCPALHCELMDTLTTEQRSERMSRVRGVDSEAELLVRRVTHRLGYQIGRAHV